MGQTKIANLINGSGKSKTVLAREVGCSIAMISYIKSGHRIPRPSLSVKLAGALGVTIDELMLALMEVEEGREERRAA